MLPTPGANQREGVVFWRSAAGKWRSTECGQPRAPLQQVIAACESAVNQLGNRHESSRTTTKQFVVREQTGPLNRSLGNLADTLQKAGDAADDTDGRQDIQSFADHSGNIARTCELLQTDARNSPNPPHIARQSEIHVAHSLETEPAGHRLNVMATIFLPLTAGSVAVKLRDRR